MFPNSNSTMLLLFFFNEVTDSLTKSIVTQCHGSARYTNSCMKFSQINQKNQELQESLFVFGNFRRWLQGKGFFILMLACYSNSRKSSEELNFEKALTFSPKQNAFKTKVPSHMWGKINEKLREEHFR